MAAVPISLGQAVRAATHRALEARARLLADYPEWEDWRRQVRAAKAAMVDHYPEFVAQLRKKVKAWGGEVCLAGDAAEARDIILKVAKRHGVAKVVQSAVANARENGDVDDAQVFVSEARADMAPTRHLSRLRPRARGMGNVIRRSACHIRVVLATYSD